MKPIILITHKYSEMETWGVGRKYCITSNYCRALIAAGAVPLLTAGGDAAEMAVRADGILFTGGAADVDPALYGEEVRGAKGSDPELDAMECELYRAFLAAKKPMLGICRGIQIMNVAAGGSLVQDIPSEVGEGHGVNSRHTVHAVEGSVPRQLFGEWIETNSYHHEAVKRCGEGLRPVCFAPDGVVEAIEHESLPILGLQWHPERLVGEEEMLGQDMRPLFAWFTARCAEAMR